MAEDPTGNRTRRLQIGKYRVIRHVATGGMGAVYRAENATTGEVVALKVLSPEMASNPVMLARFRREANHALKIKHDNIVRLYECGQASGVYFLAFEFIEGIDLHEYIGLRRQLDVDEARAFLIQAARALEHLHALGIVHRDIKPSNFLVTNRPGRPVLKLIDLGLAREVKAEEFRLTRASYTLGTVDYMSPEQARDSGTADIRSDLYSLGCTFYHMLAGQPPFNGGTLTERILAHREDDVPDIRQFNPGVPRMAVRILRRLMAKHPDDRYQTPTELLDDLAPSTSRKAGDGKGVLATLAAEDEWVASNPEIPRPKARQIPLREPAASGKDTQEVAADRTLFGVRLDSDVTFYGAVTAATVFLLIAAILILLHFGRH